MRMKSVLTHALQALAEGSLIALLIVGLMAGSVFAGKGGQSGKPSGGGTGATLNLVMLNDVGTSGLSYGDKITFTSNTTVAYPEVGLRCYQGAAFVFDGYVSLYDSWLNQDLTLVSTQWNRSLNASCTARLFYYDSRSREKILTTMALTVVP